MIVGGVWVGWGLGDWSHNPDGTDRDPTVRNAKAFMRAMYRSYAGGLADTNVFDQEMLTAVTEMQRRLELSGHLVEGQFLHGVLDLPTEIAMGFRKAPPKTLPLVFCVEGHLSNMFVGPTMTVGTTLEAEGRCHCKPIAYDNWDLPFHNKSGVVELGNQLGSTSIEGPPVDPNNPDGPKVMWPFPAGTPWSILGFSQGSMVVCDFMRQRVLPANGDLHWRLADFRRGLTFGNPDREKDKVAPWVINPVHSGTHGIMDPANLFVTTGTALEGKWAEHATHGDMFAENGDDQASQDKTAIAKIITQGNFLGPVSMFGQVLKLFGNPVGEGYAAIKASFDAIFFLASNPNPHYNTEANAGDIGWIRDGLA